jgi:hypothetical protein
MPPITADELLAELDRTEETLRQAARRRGQGCGPDFERRLQAHLRVFRVMLDDEGLIMAKDALDAAKRAMNSGDRSAPLLNLEIARKSLRSAVQRNATMLRQRDAA